MKKLSKEVMDRLEWQFKIGSYWSEVPAGLQNNLTELFQEYIDFSKVSGELLAIRLKSKNRKKQSKFDLQDTKIAKALQEDEGNDDDDDDDIYRPRKIPKPDEKSSIMQEILQPKVEKPQINQESLQSLWNEVQEMKKKLQMEEEQSRTQKQEQERLIEIQQLKEKELERERALQQERLSIQKLKQEEIKREIQKLKEQEVQKFRELEIQQQNENLKIERQLREEKAQRVQMQEELTQILLIQEIAVCSEKEAKEALQITKDFDKAVELIFHNKNQIIQEEKDQKTDDFEEKVQTLVALEICTKEEARKALEKYGDFELTLHFLNEKIIENNALEYCLGDKKTQQELLQSDIASLKEEILILNSLTVVQVNALKYVSKKAKVSSDAAYPFLLSRVRSLGFTREDLDRTLIYIRDDAPVIIHFNLTRVLKFFVESDRYKNQFETNMSGGCLSHPSRVQWEDVLFGKVYHNSNGRDRVKYGVLNIVKDANGIKCCAAYGRSFFVLKNVKLRTTLANGDTGGGNQELATCLYYCSVLNKYHDNELRSVIECATGIKKFGDDSQVITSYKEAQIHGDIFFHRDIQSLFYSNAELKVSDKEETLKLLERFRTQFKVEIIPIDD